MFGKSLVRKVVCVNAIVRRGSSNPIGIYEPRMAVARLHSSSQLFPRPNTQAWVSLTLQFLKMVLEKHGVELEMEHLMMMYKIFAEHRDELGMCFAGVGFIYNLLKSKEAKSAEREEKVRRMLRSRRYLEVLRAEMLAKESEKTRPEAEQVCEVKESGAEKVGRIITVTENLDDVKTGKVCKLAKRWKHKKNYNGGGR